MNLDGSKWWNPIRKGGACVLYPEYLLLSTSTYFVFLVGVFALYWPLSRFRAAALAVILFANYFFYARWDLLLLAIVPVAASCDFFIGLGLQKSKTNPIWRL